MSSLIDNLAARHWAYTDGVLPAAHAGELRELVLRLKSMDKMSPASIGRSNEKRRDETVRSDFIQWIENWDSDPILKGFESYLRNLMDQVRQELRVSLKRIEASFSLYPKKAFYHPHRDQHADSQHRQLTFVLYLNDWKKGDGGELLLHDEAGLTQTIEPISSRFVVFRSNLLHEVLPTQKDRVSIIGWMRDDVVLI